MTKPAPHPPVQAAGRIKARLVAALTPPQGPTPARIALRTGLGCGMALVVAGAVPMALGLSGAGALLLVPPLGATALLVVTVPNSPLAQPWPVLVGNTVAALVGLVAAQLVPLPLPAAALALGVVVPLMLMLRALHPPAGAVALVPVLSPEIAETLGLRFVLTPVALDSLLLVAFAILWHRSTGRVYPFRQPDEAPRAAARFGRDELAAILSRLRLSQNIGVADFARLLAAADEIRSADDRTAGLSCADAAGPMPPVLAPQQPLPDARAVLLDAHSYTLPVADADGRLLGVLSQSDLLRWAGAPEATVGAVMTRRPVSLPIGAPLRDALSVLARGGWRAVPLTDPGGRVTGMLTRADLIAVLARSPDGPVAPLPDGAQQATRDP